MKYSFTQEILTEPEDRYKSTIRNLSCLTSSDLQAERDRLLKSDKCTPEDLDKIVAIEEILEKRGEKPVNVSTKMKPWIYVAGGVVAGLLGVNLLGVGKQPAYYQAQPINPNSVSVPAGAGTNVFNFDND